MKLKLGNKTESGWLVLDEMGNEVFIFTGLHLDDLRQILKRFNGRYEDAEVI